MILGSFGALAIFLNYHFQNAAHAVIPLVQRSPKLRLKVHAISWDFEIKKKKRLKLNILTIGKMTNCHDLGNR